MKKIKSFVKGHIRETIEFSTLIFVMLVLGIVFYSYSTNITWDATEYIGLADLIGTEKMRTDWIGHRGIGFPLLIKISQIFGKNSVAMLTLMFLFYSVMIISLYLIYRKLKNNGILKNPLFALIYLGFSVIIIALNPILFGYYHTVLTEFVGMTLAILTCTLSWFWIDYTWKDNKISIILTAIAFVFISILTYHVKQSLIVFVITPIIVSTIISIYSNFSYSNIVSKLATIFTVILLLVISIKSWGNYMTCTSFGIGQIFKFILILLIGIAVFAFVSFIGIKFAKKHNLERKISNICKWGSIAVFLIVLIFGYNHYNVQKSLVYACDLSEEEKEQYDKEFEDKINKALENKEPGIEFVESFYDLNAGKDLDVVALSNYLKLNGRLLFGAISYPYANDLYYKWCYQTWRIYPPELDRNYISYQDNFEIEKIIKGIPDKYSKFTVYKYDTNKKLLVYFYNTNDFISQLDFCIRVLVNYPSDLYSRYKSLYWNIIYVKEGEFSPYDRENYNIPSKIYQKDILNLVDYNPTYKHYAEIYLHGIEENLVTKSLNWYMNKAIFVLLYKTETALWYMPIVLLFITVLYIVLKLFIKKVGKEKISLLQLIIILYSTAFFGIMSYIMLAADIERYTIPGQIPALMAYFLTGILFLDFVIYIVKKVIELKYINKKTNTNKA